MRYSVKGFTLIEMMIVLAIIALMSVAFYAPYGFHQKKVSLRLGAKEVSQSLAEARNMAINGIDSGSGNLSVALKFASDSENIEYYVSRDEINLANYTSAQLLKTKHLPAGVRLESFDGYEGDFVIFFEKIKGSETFFPASSVTPDDQIDFLLSFWGSSEALLQTQVKYYPQSHISDY